MFDGMWLVMAWPVVDPLDVNKWLLLMQPSSSFVCIRLFFVGTVYGVVAISKST